jgi:hypothetical protein
MSIGKEEAASLKAIMEETPEIPSSCQWVTFLRNQFGTFSFLKKKMEFE